MGFLVEKKLRFGLLKRSVSEAVRSCEPQFARANPSQNLHRLSQPLTEHWSLEPPPFFARPFLIRSSSLERTHIRSSEPLLESCSLEPFWLFARPFLTWTNSLEQTFIRWSEPLSEYCSLE